jgi:hypothetical protein
MSTRKLKSYGVKKNEAGKNPITRESSRKGGIRQTFPPVSDGDDGSLSPEMKAAVNRKQRSTSLEHTLSNGSSRSLEHTSSNGSSDDDGSPKNGEEKNDNFDLGAPRGVRFDASAARSAFGGTPVRHGKLKSVSSRAILTPQRTSAGSSLDRGSKTRVGVDNKGKLTRAMSSRRSVLSIVGGPDGNEVPTFLLDDVTIVDTKSYDRDDVANKSLQYAIVYRKGASMGRGERATQNMLQKIGDLCGLLFQGNTRLEAQRVFWEMDKSDDGYIDIEELKEGMLVCCSSPTPPF